MVSAPSVIVADGRVRFRSRVYRFQRLSRGADVSFKGGRFGLVPRIGRVSRRVSDDDLVLSAVRRVRWPSLLYAAILSDAETRVDVEGRVGIFRGMSMFVFDIFVLGGSRFRFYFFARRVLVPFQFGGRVSSD